LAETVLELDDIQSGVLRPRPAPYAATYVLFRIDDRSAGRELMRRLRSVVAPVARSGRNNGDTWVSVALSYHGLKALGVRRRRLKASRRSSSRAWPPVPNRWATAATAVQSTGRNRSDQPS